MFDESNKLGFIFEDIKRAQKVLRGNRTEEEVMEELVKELSATEKTSSLDPKIMEFADGYGRRALVSSMLLNLDPVETIGMTLLVGMQLGMVIEQTKPERTLTLQFMSDKENIC